MSARQRVVIFAITCAAVGIIALNVTLLMPLQKPYGGIINVAGRNRMLSQRFVREVMYEKLTRRESAKVKEAHNEFETAMNSLLNGGSVTFSGGTVTSIVIPGQHDARIKRQLNLVERKWMKLEESVASFRREKDSNAGYGESLDDVMGRGDELTSSLDAVVMLMVQEWRHEVFAILFVEILLVFTIAGSVFSFYKFMERTKMLDEANRKLGASERLATIGKLSGMVAHELRNPLATADTSCYILSSHGHDPELRSRHVNKISNEIRKCAGIIDSMQRMSKLEQPRREMISIGDLVNEALQQTDVPECVDVKVKADPGLTVNIDVRQWIIALKNLKTNAIHAMPDGGTLIVEGLRKGELVEIRISDTGAGISQNELEYLFDPLFSTKVTGMGLGLTIVKMIVDQHNGSIDVISKPGAGTTFSIAIPA